MTRRLSPEEVEYVVDKATDAVWHYCNHISGDDVVECLWSHVDCDLECIAGYVDADAYALMLEADDESLGEIERRVARELEFIAADVQKELCKEFDPEFEERIPYYCQAFY